MKKITTKEKRRVIILILINLFALFVNYFGLSPKITNGSYTSRNEIYLLTDSKETTMISSRSNFPYGLYKMRSPKNFWPFTKFMDRPYTNSYYIKSRFRGIFPDFDHTEFIVYSILILGILFIKRIW